MHSPDIDPKPAINGKSVGFFLNKGYHPIVPRPITGVQHLQTQIFVELPEAARAKSHLPTLAGIHEVFEVIINVLQVKIQRGLAGGKRTGKLLSLVFAITDHC